MEKGPGQVAARQPFLNHPSTETVNCGGGNRIKRRSFILLIALLTGSTSSQCLAAYQDMSEILPQPSGAPQLITAENDTLIQFLNEAAPPRDFRILIGQAAVNHPSVLQALAMREQVLQDRADAKAELMPQIGVNLSSERALARNFGKDSDNVIERSRPAARVDAVLTGEQLLFDFGASLHRIRSATARTKAAEAKARDLAVEAAIKAVAAYYDVLTNRLLTELGRSFVARSKQILENVRFRFEQGYGPAADVILVEGHVASAENQLAGLQRRLSAAQARYLEVVRTPPPASMVRPALLESAILSGEDAIRAAKTLPSVQAAEALLEGSKQDQKAAVASRFPRISAVVDATRYDAFGQNSDHDVRGRIVLSHNIFGKGATSTQAHRAWAQVKQAEFAAQQSLQEAERDASIAFSDVEALKAQFQSLINAYIGARRTRDLMVEQQKVSRANLTDLLRTEREFFSAATNLVEGSSELDLARYNLLSRTGRALEYFNIVIDSGEGLNSSAPQVAVASNSVQQQPSASMIPIQVKAKAAPVQVNISTVVPKQDEVINPLLVENVAVDLPVKLNSAELPRTDQSAQTLVQQFSSDMPSASLQPSVAMQGWAVQLGAFGATAHAKRYWDVIKTLPALAASKPQFFVENSLTKIRVPAGVSRQSADKLCASVVAQGHTCFVVSSRSDHGRFGSN